MSCLSVSYMPTDASLFVRSEWESTLAITAGVEETTLAVGAVMHAGIDTEATVDIGDLAVMYGYSLMSVSCEIESNLAVKAEVGSDFSVAATRVDGLSVAAERKDGLSVACEIFLPTLHVDYGIICTVPDMPYLDLSKYNIWVVPEYYENVDVYSNTSWVIH